MYQGVKTLGGGSGSNRFEQIQRCPNLNLNLDGRGRTELEPELNFVFGSGGSGSNRSSEPDIGSTSGDASSREDGVLADLGPCGTFVYLSRACIHYWS